jgi:hypothetical protein
MSGCFIASIYSNLWYFGIVSEVNAEEKDVTVKFLHPPSVSFFSPKREDVCACSTHPSCHCSSGTSENSDWKNLPILLRMHNPCSQSSFEN